MSGENDTWQSRAQEVMDGKAKPPGSLGVLETWAVRLCALQRTLRPAVSKACLLVFAADHGITLDQPTVSAYPRQVTPAIFGAIVRNQAASSVLCAANDCCLHLVDVGVDADVSTATSATPHITVHHAKLARGTASFLAGPAMTQEQCAAAIAEGRQAVDRVLSEMQGSDGADGAAAAAAREGAPGLVLCIGELGIGNTTSAAALVAALTGAAPAEVCGRGTGLDDAGLCGKQKVVAAALAANAQLLQQGRGEQQAQQQDQKQHAFRVLQALGGLEIAAMVGAYVHAAQHSVPVIVDGFISGAAALVALAMEPAFVGRALLLSHMSAEKGTQVLTTALSAGLQGCGAGTSGSSTAGSTAQQGDGEVSESAAEAAQAGQQQQQQQQEEQRVVMIPQPVLNMDLRLGEGTGAVMCLPLLRSAAAIACNMASLADVMAAQ